MIQIVKILFYTFILFVTVKSEEVQEVNIKFNPYNLKQDAVFFTAHGQVSELYDSEGEIRNILAPPLDSYKEFNTQNPIDANKHPPIYFNLYKNGKNEGVYLLKNGTATKLIDGTDSTTDYPMRNLSDSRIIYISSNDGIYTFNPNNEELKKFGNITEEFKAIDKTTADKDEIYVLAGDSKIYKITSQGTVKTKVDGIDYAKDFVVDLLDNIYFLDENNEPRVLIKDSANSEKVSGLNVEVKNAFLCRGPWNRDELGRTRVMVPFVVDGVCYSLVNKFAEAVWAQAVVPGLTAYSAEWRFLQFYGREGRIYMHNLWAPKS